jgi:hypothetical protein
MTIEDLNSWFSYNSATVADLEIFMSRTFIVTSFRELCPYLSTLTILVTINFVIGTPWHFFQYQT